MTNFISEFGSLAKLKTLSYFGKNKKILLVTGKDSFARCGAKTIVEKILEDQNTIQFSNFFVNPKLDDAISGAKLAREEKIDIIIGIGGGSVIDMAKLIKALYLSKDKEINLIKGNLRLSDPKIPLIAIPTTAGSGSEATHFAVVYIGEDKYSLASEYLLPNAVILDGELVTTASRYQKTCSALDAMAQAIESFWAVGSTQESRQFSLTALKLGWGILPNFISGNCSPEITQNMLLASNFAGKAINISKTTSAHAWSYAFTSKLNVPHGHAVWLTLPQIFEIHAHANESQVIDKRGLDHLRNMIRNLSNVLKLTHTENYASQLFTFLQSIEIESNMAKLGADSNSIRSLICNLVNLERMQNNPVNLNNFRNDIFHLDK